MNSLYTKACVSFQKQSLITKGWFVCTKPSLLSFSLLTEPHLKRRFASSFHSLPHSSDPIPAKPAPRRSGTEPLKREKIKSFHRALLHITPIPMYDVTKKADFPMWKTKLFVSKLASWGLSGDKTLTDNCKLSKGESGGCHRATAPLLMIVKISRSGTSSLLQGCEADHCKRWYGLCTATKAPLPAGLSVGPGMSY